MVMPKLNLNEEERKIHFRELARKNAEKHRMEKKIDGYHKLVMRVYELIKLDSRGDKDWSLDKVVDDLLNDKRFRVIYKDES